RRRAQGARGVLRKPLPADYKWSATPSAVAWLAPHRGRCGTIGIAFARLPYVQRRLTIGRQGVPGSGTRTRTRTGYFEEPAWSPRVVGYFRPPPAAWPCC